MSDEQRVDLFFDEYGVLKVEKRFVCGNEFASNYEPESGWSGSVYCELPSHEPGTTHIGFTPSGNPREWRDNRVNLGKQPQPYE